MKPLEVEYVRKCRGCGVIKLEKEFTYYASGKSWHYSKCRDCRSPVQVGDGRVRARTLAITDKGRADLRAWEAEHAA